MTTILSVCDMLLGSLLKRPPHSLGYEGADKYRGHKANSSEAREDGTAAEFVTNNGETHAHLHASGQRQFLVDRIAEATRFLVRVIDCHEAAAHDLRWHGFQRTIVLKRNCAPNEVDMATDRARIGNSSAVRMLGMGPRLKAKAQP